MRCIFCKSDSSLSKSVEHIIPESLGNKEHILPPGVVCDRCNNYFSRKIEKELLEQPYFSSVRSRNVIRSKKGKFPGEKGVLLSPPTPIELSRDKQGSLSLIVEDENAFREILSGKKMTFFTPAIDMPEKNEPVLSRFIGKVGIEYLAKLLMDTEGGLEEIVQKKELDKLRKYVRYGDPHFVWPYNMRRIYSEGENGCNLKKKVAQRMSPIRPPVMPSTDDLQNGNTPGETFSSKDGPQYEVLHEFRLLYTDSWDLYIVMAIMGIEYCLNMDGPFLDSYIEWLKKNNNRSPLENELCGERNISTID